MSFEGPLFNDAEEDEQAPPPPIEAPPPKIEDEDDEDDLFERIEKFLNIGKHKDEEGERKGFFSRVEVEKTDEDKEDKEDDSDEKNEPAVAKEVSEETAEEVTDESNEGLVTEDPDAESLPEDHVAGHQTEPVVFHPEELPEDATPENAAEDAASEVEPVLAGGPEVRIIETPPVESTPVEPAETPAFDRPEAFFADSAADPESPDPEPEQPQPIVGDVEPPVPAAPIEADPIAAVTDVEPDDPDGPDDPAATSASGTRPPVPPMPPVGGVPGAAPSFELPDPPDLTPYATKQEAASYAAAAGLTSFAGSWWLNRRNKKRIRRESQERQKGQRNLEESLQKQQKTAAEQRQELDNLRDRLYKQEQAPIEAGPTVVARAEKTDVRHEKPAAAERVDDRHSARHERWSSDVHERIPEPGQPTPEAPRAYESLQRGHEDERRHEIKDEPGQDHPSPAAPFAHPDPAAPWQSPAQSITPLYAPVDHQVPAHLKRQTKKPSSQNLADTYKKAALTGAAAAIAIVTIIIVLAMLS